MAECWRQIVPDRWASIRKDLSPNVFMFTHHKCILCKLKQTNHQRTAVGAYLCGHSTQKNTETNNKPIISILQWVHTYVVTQHKKTLKQTISVLQWVHTYVVTQHTKKLKQTNHQHTAVGAYLCGHSTQNKLKQTNHQRTAVGAYLCGHSTQNKLKQTISVLQWVHTYVVTQHKKKLKQTISELQWVHTYVVTQHTQKTETNHQCTAVGAYLCGHSTHTQN